MKRVLFVGNQKILHELVAEILNVEPIFATTEEQAISLFNSVNCVVTGHVNRSNKFFKELNKLAINKPCVVFSSFIIDQKTFEGTYPRLSVVEKGLGTSELEYLRSCLQLKPN